MPLMSLELPECAQMVAVVQANVGLLLQAARACCATTSELGARWLITSAGSFLANRLAGEATTVIGSCEAKLKVKPAATVWSTLMPTLTVVPKLGRAVPSTVQPVKLVPVATVAVRFTVVPDTKGALQVPLVPVTLCVQLMPAGELTTVPSPVMGTVRVWVFGGGALAEPLSAMYCATQAPDEARLPLKVYVPVAAGNWSKVPLRCWLTKRSVQPAFTLPEEYPLHAVTPPTSRSLLVLTAGPVMEKLALDPVPEAQQASSTSVVLMPEYSR